jgi:hypothetical protein
MSNPFAGWTSAQCDEFNSRPKYTGMAARIESSMASELAAPVEHERDLHKQIQSECNRRGWLCLHGSMAHKAMRTLGEPDFTIGGRGQVWFVECKSRIGKRTREQEGLAMVAEKNGLHIHLVRSFQAFLAIVDGPPEHVQTRD